MKDIRLTLPDELSERFTKQKREVEKKIGITLRDNEFANRVIAQAIKAMEEAK